MEETPIAMVRRDETGLIDEVIAAHVTVHMERLYGGLFRLDIGRPGGRGNLIVNLFTDDDRSPINCTIEREE